MWVAEIMMSQSWEKLANGLTWPGTLEFMVRVRAIPTVSLLSPPVTQTYFGAPIVFTGRVAAKSGAAIPAGTVFFREGPLEIGMATLDSAGIDDYVIGDCKGGLCSPEGGNSESRDSLF